jgi:hypothetical protein
MSTEANTTAAEQLSAAVAGLAAGLDAGMSATEILDIMRAAQSACRSLERVVVSGAAALSRQGALASHGYRSPVPALMDAFGWERFEARRCATVAESVHPSTSLTGEVLPPRLPATALAFTTETIGVRHVETIARLLESGAARRLDPPTWAEAEIELARYAAACTPAELHRFGVKLIDALDIDGTEPDDGVRDQVNELHIKPFKTKPGGRIEGRFDDPTRFAEIAGVVNALATPRDRDDQRTTAERQADGLAEACAQVMTFGDLPETGGHRPQLVVTMDLDELENRARGALLEFGGRLHPAALRRLACDAAVIPIVLNGDGVPLDVGRASRAIPDGIRRAVRARDQGCAHPGCDRPPSWCEIHHVIEWQHGGPTAVSNLVMLCRQHHRQVHDSGWEIQMSSGIPVFIPPAWIDPHRVPRRRLAAPRLRRDPFPTRHRHAA